MMTRHGCFAALLLALLAGPLVVGCRSEGPFQFAHPKAAAHYQTVATKLETPKICEGPEKPSYSELPPLTLESFAQYDLWDLTLHEAVRLALVNSQIIRQLSPAEVLPVGGAAIPEPAQVLLRAPEASRSIYGPAIAETGVYRLQRGVEAALSDFDAQLDTSIFWEKNERPINVNPPSEDIYARDFVQDRGLFQAELSKRTAMGSRVYLRHNVEYDQNNNPTRAVPSDYALDYELGVVQPLLQGAGPEFNRIAGPNSSPGFYNGVLIARINTDQALADFEAAVRDLVYQVEVSYWEVYMAYRALAAARTGRDTSLINWRRAKALLQAGPGDAAHEAQARSELFRFRGEVEDALRDLYRAESRLRYLMGMPAGGPELIRPATEPTNVRVVFNWSEAQSEANFRLAELRRQRWDIKRRELELVAARNFLLPRLDATAGYRWVGAGDHLIDPNGRGVPPFAGSDAYSTLTDGNFQGWQLGLQLNVPIGFRLAHTAVRNAELELARSRALLEEQELEVAHLLAEAIRDAQFDYGLILTRYNNWLSAEDELRSVLAAFQVGRISYDQLLDATARRAQAETNYYRSLVNYNRSLAEVHLRKGSLLQYNEVFLAEGGWPVQAYQDAKRKKHRRWPLNYVIDCKTIVSRGPAPQRVDHGFSDSEMMPAETFQQPPAEPVQTPPLPPRADAGLPSEMRPQRLAQQPVPARR